VSSIFQSLFRNRNDKGKNEITRLSLIGIIIVELLMGAVSLLMEPIPDHEVISIPDIQPVVILIAFLVGMIGAGLFIRETEKSEI
jgi:hypothetical protein